LGEVVKAPAVEKAAATVAKHRNFILILYLIQREGAGWCNTSKIEQQRESSVL
jgi:hypothetical protein